MNLKISSPPHLYQGITTPYIMQQVIFALLPATFASIYFFGVSAIYLILNCVLTSVITEGLVLRIRKIPKGLEDFSAVLTGLLLALILPPQIAWYGATFGSIVAILVGKHIFGGLGSNIFNPALVGRAFLMAGYPKMLTTFTLPRGVDSISSATPLALLKFNQSVTSTFDLFFGKTSGSLGETCAFLLILGGLYLFIRKIADWRTPLSLLLTVTFISIIGFKLEPLNGSVLFHLFSGGLLLGAFFMVTDPVTTPVTKKGRYIFGISCGVIIMIIRYFSGLPEGVMYSILFMNAFTPLINRCTKPKRFGT